MISAKAESDRQALAAALEQQFVRTYVTVPRDAPSSPAVIAVGADGRTDARLANALANAIGGSTGLFKPSFVADGLFAKALGGDVSVLDRLQLTRTVPVIVLGAVELSHAGAEVAGVAVTKATARITLRIFRGSRSTAVVVEESASAFSVAEAHRRATDAATTTASSRLKVAL